MRCRLNDKGSDHNDSYSPDPDALKIPARRAEFTLTENASSPFHAEPAQRDENGVLAPCSCEVASTSTIHFAVSGGLGFKSPRIRHSIFQGRPLAFWLAFFHNQCDESSCAKQAQKRIPTHMTTTETTTTDVYSVWSACR